MTDVRPRYQLVGLDCPDPVALATFYSRLTGLDVEPLGDFKPDEVEWIELDNGQHPTIAFQKVPNYVAPTWPTGAIPQQLHLDFLVPDLDEGEAARVSRRRDETRVPAGHHVPGLSRSGGPSVLSRAFERLTSLTLSTP
jgi:hypothetical protein